MQARQLPPRQHRVYGGAAAHRRRRSRGGPRTSSASGVSSALPSGGGRVVRWRTGRRLGASAPRPPPVAVSMWERQDLCEGAGKDARHLQVHRVAQYTNGGYRFTVWQQRVACRDRGGQQLRPPRRRIPTWPSTCCTQVAPRHPGWHCRTRHAHLALQGAGGDSPVSVLMCIRPTRPVANRELRSCVSPSGCRLSTIPDHVLLTCSLPPSCPRPRPPAAAAPAPFPAPPGSAHPPGRTSSSHWDASRPVEAAGSQMEREATTLLRQFMAWSTRVTIPYASASALELIPKQLVVSQYQALFRGAAHTSPHLVKVLVLRPQQHVRAEVGAGERADVSLGKVVVLRGRTGKAVDWRLAVEVKCRKLHAHGPRRCWAGHCVYGEGMALATARTVRTRARHVAPVRFAAKS